MVRRVQGEGLLSGVRAEKGFLPPQITEVGQDHWRSPSVTPPMTLPPPGLREPGEHLRVSRGRHRSLKTVAPEFLITQKFSSVWDSLTIPSLILDFYGLP